MRGIVLSLIILYSFMGHSQHIFQGKYKSPAADSILLYIHNNQAVLSVHDGSKISSFWGDLTKNDTTLVFAPNIEPSEYYAYYKKNNNIEPNKRKITIKTHRAPYQTEFAIGRNLTMNDSKRLDNFNDDPYEVGENTTVYEFYVDKIAGDTAMISRMVYSNYIEFHYALPNDANDILFVRNDNPFIDIPFINFYPFGNIIFLDNMPVEEFLYYKRSLHTNEVDYVLNAIPPLQGYAVLRKSRYLMPMHMDSQKRLE